MGLSSRQLLWSVEVPLAMPVIIAGVRIATVSSIGLITIAALIGRGGFGQFILDGLNTFFWTPLMVGRGAVGGLGAAGGPAAPGAAATGDALDEGGRDPGGGHVNVFVDGLQWLVGL